MKAVLVIFVAVFAALSLWHGTQAARSDASALHARWVVNEWRDGKGPTYTPQLWQETLADLQAALQTAPGNAQLFDDIGFLYAARQQYPEAIANYRAATTLRPTFPYSWAYLALAKHLQGQQDAEFWRAFDKALQYGTNEAGVQPTLGQIAFAQWPALGADRQRHITQMVTTAQAASKTRLLAMAAQNGITLASQ
jgi:tetratricopeptide (TPR) repeat protein